MAGNWQGSGKGRAKFPHKMPGSGSLHYIACNEEMKLSSPELDMLELFVIINGIRSIS